MENNLGDFTNEMIYRSVAKALRDICFSVDGIEASICSLGSTRTTYLAIEGIFPVFQATGKLAHLLLMGKKMWGASKRRCLVVGEHLEIEMKVWCWYYGVVSSLETAIEGAFDSHMLSIRK